MPHPYLVLSKDRGQIASSSLTSTATVAGDEVSSLVLVIGSKGVSSSGAEGVVGVVFVAVGVLSPTVPFEGEGFGASPKNDPRAKALINTAKTTNATKTALPFT